MGEHHLREEGFTEVSLLVLPLCLCWCLLCPCNLHHPGHHLLRVLRSLLFLCSFSYPRLLDLPFLWLPHAVPLYYRKGELIAFVLLSPRTSISTDRFSCTDYVVPLTHHLLSRSTMTRPSDKGRRYLVRVHSPFLYKPSYFLYCLSNFDLLDTASNIPRSLLLTSGSLLVFVVLLSRRSSEPSNRQRPSWRSNPQRKNLWAISWSIKSMLVLTRTKHNMPHQGREILKWAWRHIWSS